MSYRWMALIVGVVFAVTLGVVVGQRLSTTAMLVTLGVLAGIAASIPTSLVMVWVTLRLQPAIPPRPAEPPPEPRVVVLQTPMMPPAAPTPAQANWTPQNYPPPTEARPNRQFTIIGGPPDQP